jgi:hypothetical protein
MGLGVVVVDIGDCVVVGNIVVLIVAGSVNMGNGKIFILLIGGKLFGNFVVFDTGGG